MGLAFAGAVGPTSVKVVRSYQLYRIFIFNTDNAFDIFFPDYGELEDPGAAKSWRWCRAIQIWAERRFSIAEFSTGLWA